MSGFTRPHVIGFVANLFFSTPESGFIFFLIRCRIRRIAVSGKKKLRIRKYPDTCGRGLNDYLRVVAFAYIINCDHSSAFH